MTAEHARIHCDERLELTALSGLPIIVPGDDLSELLAGALERAGVAPREPGRDVLVVTSKVVSRAEDRFVELNSVQPGPRALELAARTHKDPRLCELVLQESQAVSRAAPGVLIVRHRLGFVSANAGIDESNVDGNAAGSVLLLPQDPDASARALRAALQARFGVDLAVVISDSHGRPFRLGAVGTAIGISGLSPLWDQRGARDLHGRVLQHTWTALADQIAAAADLVAGQGSEGRPAVHVRGIRFEPVDSARASALVRPAEEDLYA